MSCIIKDVIETCNKSGHAGACLLYTSYMSDLYGASLRVADAQVFFADTEGVEEFPPETGTWISAYSLRWRVR